MFFVQQSSLNDTTAIREQAFLLRVRRRRAIYAKANERSVVLWPAHQEGEQEDVLRMDELRMTGTVGRADKHTQMDQLVTVSQDLTTI